VWAESADEAASKAATQHANDTAIVLGWDAVPKFKDVICVSHDARELRDQINKRLGDFGQGISAGGDVNIRASKVAGRDLVG